MLFLLSPVKTLDYGTLIADLPRGRPHFARRSAELIEELRQKSLLKALVVDCVFEERKGIGYKIISFPAKRARGPIACYTIEKRVATPRQLQAFAGEGYSFDPGASRADRMVFRRRIDQ